MAPSPAGLPRLHHVPSFDGHPVAAWDFGPSEAEAAAPVDVLLTHANGFHALAYLPVVKALGARVPVRVVGFDLRGQGATPPPAGLHFDWNHFAADALAVLDHFGLRAPLGFGHSGGGAALAIAEEARPGAFRGLFLYEPILFPPRIQEGAGPGNVLAQAARKRRQVFASRADARANYAAKLPFSRFRPDALDAYVEHGFEDQPDRTVVLAARGEHEARVYESELNHRGFEGLATIACPVTVAHGTLTDMPPIEMFGAAASRIPRGRLLPMDGLAHFGPFEDPDTVADAVAALLGELSP